MHLKKLKESALKIFINGPAIDHASKIEKLINLYGTNGFSVGNSLTW